ncbi:MAG: deoxyhypusine synthase [Nitrospinota bacterium]|nr:deoxyhypusine synthase [Nitrospinota bacterium]
MKESFKGTRIASTPIPKGISVDELIEKYFGAYNAARIAETCKLLERKIIKKDVILGVSLSGALTPTGLGSTALVTWIENGWIDYIVSTGANLYHDLHFGLDLPLHRSTPFVDDVELRKQNLIRIYDIVFDFDVLYKSDKYLYRILQEEEFDRQMGTAELHYLIGKYVDATEKELGCSGKTVLAAAYRNGVPCYCPSPGDSTIGLNIAALSYNQSYPKIEPSIDVKDSAAIAYHAKTKGESAVMILGGGSPKNFLLQTIPLLDEIMEIHVKGHDYFIQITDARPDTGGLSGATPWEAVSWGKVDPEMVPDSIVCYTDTTIALPLITAYLLNRVEPREHKRLYDKRDDMHKTLSDEYKNLIRSKNAT